MFDVFPGAPAVTGGNTIVFKGNFTVDNVGKTGVFYRTLANEPIVLEDGTELAPAGGMSDVVLIANNMETVIPGTNPPKIFGSTSPPSAANGQVVFAGFDNEEAPTLGGIYLAPLAQTPQLTTLVSIGGRVPGRVRQGHLQRPRRGRRVRRPLRGLLGRLGDGDPDRAPLLPDGRQQGPHRLLQSESSSAKTRARRLGIRTASATTDRPELGSAATRTNRSR